MSMVPLPGLKEMVEGISKERNLPKHAVQAALREALLKGYERYRRNEQRGTAADRRPSADARHPVEGRAAETRDAGRENAVDRRLQALEVHVGGREAEPPAQPEAAHDAAGDRGLEQGVD